MENTENSNVVVRLLTPVAEAAPSYNELLALLLIGVVLLGVSKFALDHPLFDGPHWTDRVAYYLWETARTVIFFLMFLLLLKGFLDHFVLSTL